MTPLLIVGSSGHAGGVIEAVELQAQYKIIGLIDPFEERDRQKHGYRVCGNLDEAPSLADAHHCRNFFVAVGDNWTRCEIASKLRAAVTGIEFPIILHPSVLVARTARIGPGTVMMAASLAANNAQIGEGCIVYTMSAVNHDCSMDDYSSISGGVHLGGGTSIGLRSSIGIGATIREKVSIGRDCVVGAGSIVLNDIPDDSLAYGVPAKVARERLQSERYMR